MEVSDSQYSKALDSMTVTEGGSFMDFSFFQLRNKQLLTLDRPVKY